MPHPKLEDWNTPEQLEVLVAWARRGLTYGEIAANIGISHPTLLKWRKIDEEFGRALRMNKDIADSLVENALFKTALGFYYEEDVVTNKGEVVKVQKYERPSNTAQIFYLKNRCYDRWNDRREVKCECSVKTDEVIIRWGGDEPAQD